MFRPLPSTLLALLFALPALSHASPQPALVGTDWEISLIPRHTLFLRQLSDLQTFGQALGGTRASAITNSGDAQRPFSVDGQTFDSFQSAAQRSCDNQFQACQNAANGNGNGNSANANANVNGAQSQSQNQNQANGNRNGGSNNNNNNGNQQNRERSRKGKRQDGGSGQEKGNEKRQSAAAFTVTQCNQQRDQCNSAQQSAQVKDFNTAVASTNIGPDPQFPDFDLICEG